MPLLKENASITSSSAFISNALTKVFHARKTNSELKRIWPKLWLNLNMCMQFPVFFFLWGLATCGRTRKRQNIRWSVILYSHALFSQTSQGRKAEIDPRWEKSICSWLVSTSAVNTFLCSKYLIRLLSAVFDICPTFFANPTYLRIRSLYKFRRLMLAQILQDSSIEPVLKGWAVNA